MAPGGIRGLRPVSASAAAAAAAAARRCGAALLRPAVCAAVAFGAAAVAVDDAVPFGKPLIEVTSGKCAAVKFSYSGGGDGPGWVYVFAKRAIDPEYMRLGEAIEARRVKTAYGPDNEYRVLVRGLPHNETFQVIISAGDELLSGASEGSSSSASASEPSAFGGTKGAHDVPRAPEALEAHRTDPRSNPLEHDGSVCLDLHWSHSHPVLHGMPSDVFFRILHNYEGEEPVVFCEEHQSASERSCGQHLDSVAGGSAKRYATVCGLRPKRHVHFRVEALNCDGEAGVANVSTMTPPSAPSVVAKLVTHPADEESAAGFFPVVHVDWIPQHDDDIVGHAIYLGLTEVSAMKLLCWVPIGGFGKYSRGHVELPIQHTNFTFSSHSDLVAAYLQKYHVHQEQELLVTTRVKGNLESPAYHFRLGNWLVMDKEVKCLTSFDAVRPSYAARDIQFAWTQEQALSDA
eukprot:TRINITY_DN6842_c0_g1_i1.p1 TRINITY_DN6842_c0_g1~~TRINITY_DN6842_c0_g1_i1.p1  ORF type:complete len:471 (-),score=104.60 TRINITY_DN6842_c0_g1_i1:93-1472(-)